MHKVLPAIIAALMVVAGLIASIIVIGPGIEIAVGVIIGAVLFAAIGTTVVIAG